MTEDMAIKEDEYYMRASILLFKGGRLMSKETLYKELRKDGESLDVILKQHKSLFTKKFARNQMEKLFPVGGVTDVKTWDLGMLITITLIIFKQSLSNVEKNALISIRFIRNQFYVYEQYSSLNADQYEDIRNALQNALTSLSNGLSKHLKDDCTNIIQECTTGTIGQSLKAELTKQIENTDDLSQAVIHNLHNQNEIRCKRKKDILDQLHKQLCVNEDRIKKIVKGTAESADEDMEGTPSWQRCSKCTCMMNCLCSCHLLHEKSEMERGTDSKDDRSQFDLKPEFGFKKNTNNVKDFDQEKPSFDPRTEHGRDLCVDEQESYDESQEVYGAFEDDQEVPPNDDSTNSDNSDDGRKNQDCISAKKEENKGNEWVIDTGVWNKCIDMKDVQEAKRLLDERILPDQDSLDSCSKVFGISSNIVHNICTAICFYIKESVVHIVHVWPALDYRHEITNKAIIFVIYRTHACEKETMQYRTHIRHVNEISPSCSEENTHIRELEHGCEKDYSKTEEIAECLNKNSKSLMEQHTNLTRVSISWFKSKGFGTIHQEMIHKICIALYVHVKGFVPLNESPLPEVIDGIDVDVRECVVHPYTFPNEHHENIKMGCAIHGGQRNLEGKFLGGTLGGFFEIDGEIYCLTSAHIVMSAANMGKLKQCGKYIDLGNDIEQFEAYQPVVDGSRSFGIGVRAVYKEGGNGETGVEAVVIKVQDRFPKSGEFPTCPHSRNAGVERQNFSTGKMCNREEISRLIKGKTLTVVKFGCSSGWTRGCFRFFAGAARLNNMVGTIHNFGILLHNQFEIENIGETKFAEYGDSGALVFTDENNELSVIGIVEGGSQDVIYVTPICDLFSALELQNVQSTKGFTLRYQGIQNIPMDITSDSYTQPAITSRSDSGISTNGEAVHQEVTKEVARQVHELKENINTNLNQELSRVKSDITNIRSDVERTKSELKQDIEKSNTEIQSKMNVMQEHFTAEITAQIQEQTNSLKSMLSELLRPNDATVATKSNAS